ncbi:MAG: tryptophan-rich sensory protein [Candidatus Thorarchaeota archaeon]
MILGLWATILFGIIWFFRTSILAGAFLIPYILWVSFAVVLNVAIWALQFY